MVADPDGQVLENLLPNHLHAEPAIAAARAGKHVVCEKPLALDAAQAREMLAAVREAGVVHMCAFNYRFVPAVRRAREMLEAGDLGEVRHFRGTYRQSWGADPAREGVWRFDPALAGGGALGDLASHVVDMARYLVGDIESVASQVATFVPGREVDDAVAAAVSFAGGAIGTIEATRFATGEPEPLHLGDQRVEGLAGVRPRAPERAGGRRRADAGEPRRLVAARARAGLGAHLRVRAAPLPRRGGRPRHGGASRRDVRGRRARGRGVRRDPALGPRRAARGYLA